MNVSIVTVNDDESMRTPSLNTQIYLQDNFSDNRGSVLDPVEINSDEEE